MDRSWENVQQRVFTRWVNAQLVKKGVKIEDVAKDFQDGLQLINLYEVISGMTFEKYHKKPTLKIHKINNLSMVINEVNKFVKTVGIHVEFSAEQVHDGDKRTILGMIWCLIHKFAIQGITEEEMSARDGLLLWCQKQTKGYQNVNVTNFNTSWVDGLAFCALIHRHHPNLIDFNSLKKEDKLGNMQLAFDVAEKHLDIPALLDANDIANSPKPDDKAVMTYVAYYWKKFASSKKGERSGRKIGKVATKQQENDKLIHDYEVRAKKLVAWMADKNAKYSDTSLDHFGNSLSKVQTTSNTFKTFKNDEKPKQNVERNDLELMLKNLNSKQKNEGMAVYVPPQDLAPQVLNSTWDNLEHVCSNYEKALREAIQRMKYLEMLLDRFRKRAQQLLDWNEAKAPYLKEDIQKLYDTINVIQARIRGQEAFDEELKGISGSNVETAKIGQEIVDGKHEAAPEVSSTMEKSSSLLESTSNESKKVMEALNEWLHFKQEIEAACIEFGNLVQQLNLVLDDAALTLIEPVNVDSVQDVEDKIAAHNKLVESYKSKQPILGNITELHNKITGAGADSGIYSSLNHDQINTKNSKLDEQLQERGAELDKAKEVQLFRVKLLGEWSEKCKDYTAWVDENKAKLNEEDSGSVWDQLKTHEEKSAAILPENDTRQQDLEQFHGTLVENEVAGKVDVTMQEMHVLHSQLENIAKKKTQDLSLKIKQLEKLADRFKARISKMQSWQDEKLTYLTNVPLKVTTISQTQAEIKTTQGIESEIQSTASAWAETKEMGTQLIDAGHAEQSQLSQSLEETESKNAKLSATQQETITTLNKILVAKQEVEKNRVEFAKLVQTINLFLEEAFLQVAESVKARSVKDVEEKIAAAEKLAQEHAEKETLLDQAREIDEKVSFIGEQSNVYSAIDLPTITDKFTKVKEQMDERATALEAEKKDQEDKAQLIQEYTDASTEYQKWVGDCNASLNNEIEGTLEQQLETLKPLSTDALKTNDEKLQSLTAMYENLEAADISENANITLTELNSLHDQITATATKRVQAIEEAIIAAKLSDVTEDQLKDWGQTFRHFDAQKQNSLTKLQFKAACAAVGEDIPDDQLEARFANYDKDKDGKIEFDEWIDFMKIISKEGSGYKDIMDAFAELAGNAPTITENQMRSVMPQEQVDYLIKVMPKAADGYDYKTYCEQSFAKKE